MNLFLDTDLGNKFKSNSQIIRVLTENWVDKQIYCPNCGNSRITKYSNNKPVADFFCENCHEDFELKSKNIPMSNKIVDGAYKTMIERLQGLNNPNLFILNYDLFDYSILNFFVIPKHFFVPEIIEKRKALSSFAKRSGWVGCNIELNKIPQSGKIYFIRDKQAYASENVLQNWKKTLFLRDFNESNFKNWILDIMNCIDRIDKNEFSLDDIYSFENYLSDKHPNNKHIRDKIRQQLQILRDKSFIKFTKRGFYSKIL